MPARGRDVFCVNIGKSDYLAGRAASQIRFGYTAKIILDLKFLFYLMSYMAKVDIELVKVILQRAELDARKIAQIMEDINFESKAKDDAEKKEPPCKKQFVMIVNDPYGKIKETGFEYSGWVVQIPEDEAPQTAIERLYKGVYDFNITPKGRRLPIKTVAEACEFGSAKVYKEHKIWVKTKEPVLLITTNGKIPREDKREEF
jgi:hypothetical protein